MRFDFQGDDQLYCGFPCYNPFSLPLSSDLFHQKMEAEGWSETLITMQEFTHCHSPRHHSIKPKQLLPIYLIHFMNKAQQINLYCSLFIQFYWHYNFLVCDAVYQTALSHIRRVAILTRTAERTSGFVPVVVCHEEKSKSLNDTVSNLYYTALNELMFITNKWEKHLKKW